MVRCHEGDTLGLFWYVRNVSCNVPIGSSYFGIESELSNAGTPVCRMRSIRSSRYESARVRTE